MAARGRPRKPTKLKLLEGNPGRRPLNTSEPQYAPTVEKPNDLTPVASEWWDLVVPNLVRVGLAQAVDAPSLTLLAEDFSAWKRASALYVSEAPVVKRGSTILVSNPLLRAVKDFGAAYRQGAAAFGLTAQSRSTLNVPDRDFEDLDRGFGEWQKAIHSQEASAAKKRRTKKAPE